MIKKLRNLIAVLALSLGLMAPIALTGSVGAQANIQDNLCSGTNFQNVGGTNCDATTGMSTEGVQSAVNTVVNLLSWIVGIVSVIMIIVGGFRYITSGGAPDKVTGAKNTIIYAVIGLVIVALAQFIVNFVIGKAVTVDG